ncbi:MAG: tetratricopeptide repeat protein, partial [Planctomycetota bacterium]
QAARDFEAINPTSKNYWRAQRKVPLCFRLLAQKETEEAKARQFHEKSRDAALKLRSLAEAKPNDPGAKKTLQYARLYTALAYHALDDWDDTLKRMGEYLTLYPDEFLKKGIELKVMIDAHLALGQLEKAEAALTLLSEKQPGSSYVDQANFDRARREALGVDPRQEDTR